MSLANCRGALSRNFRFTPFHVQLTFKPRRFYTSSGRNGIFRIACRFNHSCHPQVVYHYNRTKKELVLSTRYFIRSGEEIFISYGQGPETLLLHYGFLCSCGSCSPTEYREPKPEQWELEYWQKRASSEEVRDHFREWGTESVEGINFVEEAVNIDNAWGVESCERNSEKEIIGTFSEW